MAKAITKARLVRHLAERFELTRATGTGILGELARLAPKEARNGFTLPGIGKLVLVNRKARMGRNHSRRVTLDIPLPSLRSRALSALRAQHGILQGLGDPEPNRSPRRDLDRLARLRGSPSLKLDMEYMKRHTTQ